MNRGAFVLDAQLLTADEIQEASDLAESLQHRQRPVHEAGSYADLKWFQVDLDPAWPVAAKMLHELGAENPELLVFYYLEPGAKLHPHRDLTGASLNNRLRFHVPIITNPGVDFRVSDERVTMKPGELWCLDTSYIHSVHNGGHATRVHMIVECQITQQIRQRIPSGLAEKLHSLSYSMILAGSLVKAVTVNMVRNPAHFRQQLRMIRRYIGWRFLGTTKVE